MAHIVVLEAGIGGMPAAYKLQTCLGKTHRITAVNRGDAMRFVPSNPGVMVNWRSRKDMEIAVKAPLARKHIDLGTTAARRLGPGENRIEREVGRICKPKG